MRRRRGRMLLVAALVGVLVLLSAAASSTARQRRLLVVTEANGFVHPSIPTARGVLRRLGRRSSRYSVKVLPSARSLTARRLRHADAVAFVLNSGKLSLGRRGRARLVRWVRAGHGLAAFHSGITVEGWPAFQRLLGATFAGHPVVGSARVVVEDRTHPATRNLPAAFRLDEEYYFFKRDPRPKVHVLARLDLSSVGGNPLEDRPLVWYRVAGAGRVFYDALGHYSANWHDRHNRALVSGGLRWALGLDDVSAGANQ